MENQSGLGVALDLVDHVRKHWWAVIAGLCLGFAGALVTIHYTPKVYVATTKIYLAPPKIPTQYMDTTVVDDLQRRLSLFNESVLSRNYMLELIAREYRVPMSERETESAIRRIRNNVDTKVSGGLGYFELTYRDHDPVAAARLVNTLADLYIEQNVSIRRGRAEEARSIMEKRAESARVELDAKRREIEDYRLQHRFALSEYLDSNWKKLESKKGELELVREQLGNTRDHHEELADRREELIGKGGLADGNDTYLDPHQQNIERVRSELGDMLVHYSEEHPSVKSKRRELAELLTHGPPETNDPETGEVISPGLAVLLDEIRAAESEIARLEKNENRFVTEIAQLEHLIDSTPENDQQLIQLSDGYGLLQGKYGNLQRNAESARDVEWLEESQQGRQFEVIDRAQPPSVPAEPKPLQICVLAVAAGLGLFVGPLVLFRLQNPVLTSEAGLRASTEIPVLVSIPRVQTEEVRRVRLRRRLANMGLSVASALVLAAIFITFK